MYLASAFLYVLVYFVAGAALDGSAEAIVGNGLLVALALLVCAVLHHRRNTWDGAQRLFWGVFQVGMAMWIVGQIGSTVEQLADTQYSGIEWHTIFTVGGALAPIIAILARPDRGVRRESMATLALDLGSYGLLAGFIVSYIVFSFAQAGDPTVGGWARDALRQLLLGYRVLLVGGLGVVAWLGQRSAWRDTYIRLAAGASIGAVVRAFTNVAIELNRSRYEPGGVYDLAWIVPFLFYAWAAAAAPASPPEGDRIDVPDPPPPALIATIPALLIPLLGLGLLRLHPLGDPVDQFRVLLTAFATVAALGLLTVRVSVQRSELKRADARLKLLAAAVEQTHDLILITRADGSVEDANDACFHALGYTREQIMAKKLPDLLERGFDHMIAHIGDEVRRNGVWRGTLLHRRRDGSTFPAASTVVALKDPDGRITHFVGVQRDMTEDLRFRDQLVHTERLSAVGELVAGVAHEINNPLQTIIGSIELLIDEQRGNTPQQNDLRLVRQEAVRAGQIVRNLLAFVRRSTPNRDVADLNEIVRAVADVREYHLVQNNISLVTQLLPGPLPVLVNRDEMQQVVLNLVLNAEQAILGTERPGTITLRTFSDARMQVLDVIDDGPGVSPELRGRIFEPFFTTKEAGQGTGLGLSISLGVATSHGGALKFCEPSRPAGATTPGACFRLTIPAHAALTIPTGAALRPAEPPAKVPASGPVRRALVIDDEPPLRALLTRLLARRGYEVVEAPSAADARAAVAQGTFDLVLCDVRLGPEDGVACVRHIRATRPELERRVVFMTGDEGTLRGTAADLGAVPVLPKPFTISDLDRVLVALAGSPAT